jgi:hypothetical protein
MRHHLILHHSGIPFTTTRFLLRPWKNQITPLFHALKINHSDI